MKSRNSNRVTYIGSDGPLRKACEQVFRWKSDQQLLVVLWHTGWIWDGASYWEALHTELEKSEKEVRILIAIEGATPDVDGKRESNRVLKALLRALVTDLEPGHPPAQTVAGGWCRLTDFARLWEASLCWKKCQKSALLRLCKVAAAVSKKSAGPSSDALPRPSVAEFFHFLDDPAHFRTNSLHDRPSEAVKGLRALKWLATLAIFDPGASMNILLVENKPEELFARDKAVGERLGALASSVCVLSPLRFFPNAKYYVIREGFHEIAGKESRKGITCIPWSLDKSDFNATDCKPVVVPWGEIDLVLQDIVLNDQSDSCSTTGLELVEHYFEACPQALVFMLTSLDVETLIGSGDVNWKYVDCIISKKALATIWYEYRRCFRERFGAMFWPDWTRAEEKDRKLLRNLFGSLRRWQIEPDILWHGQTLPEMIDHAHRHISALWKLVNDFVERLMENGGANMDVLNLRHRVALAVAVWMHDVGHRGDEYIAGSTDIRASHAGISERILLRNPDAYRLAWLLESTNMPCEACRPVKEGMNNRLECRNRTTCSKDENEALCLLREAGLLCRHHQSNAPLDQESLEHMATRGKEPSIYSLTPDCDTDGMSSEKFLFRISNPALPSPSARGLKVMLLEDFKTSSPAGFRILAGLLRMLDAMQLHRSRVGTTAFIAGFNEFVENKFNWCRSERVRLEGARRAAIPGRKSFQEASAKLVELDEYEILLRTQQVHFWRQAAVHDCEIRWIWRADGTACIDACYILGQEALSHLDELGTSVMESTGKESGFNLGQLLEGNTPKEKWVQNLVEEVIESEHKSQYLKSKTAQGYLGVLRPSLNFTISAKLQKAAQSEQVFPKPP